MLAVPDGEFELALSQDSKVSGSQQSLTSTQGASTELDSITISSDSEVEILSVIVVPKALTPEQELANMKENEKFGFYWRVLERQEGIYRRLRAVSEAVAQESPEARRVRRKTFQKVILNHES